MLALYSVCMYKTWQVPLAVITGGVIRAHHHVEHILSFLFFPLTYLRDCRHDCGLLGNASGPGYEPDLRSFLRVALGHAGYPRIRNKVTSSLK